MNWLLIIILSGSIHATRVVDTEDKCATIGEQYVQNFNEKMEYVCLTGEQILDMIGEQ